MRKAKVDDNQAEIVNALRKAGCTVQHLHAVGGGCPDILVGFRSRNVLVEIKDGNKPPSQQKLNAKQEEWHEGWKGQVAVVTSVKEALELVVGFADE